MKKGGVALKKELAKRDVVITLEHGNHDLGDRNKLICYVLKKDVKRVLNKIEGSDIDALPIIKYEEMLRVVTPMLKHNRLYTKFYKQAKSIKCDRSKFMLAKKILEESKLRFVSFSGSKNKQEKSNG